MNDDFVAVVVFDFDGDSAVYHPISNKHIRSNLDGTHIFKVSDKYQFIDDLKFNRFFINCNIHSEICELIDNDKDFTDFKTGTYEFSNYKIQIIEYDNIICIY